MISADQALQAILERVEPGEAECVPLHRAAGRVLRHDVRAESSAPPFDRVMMDGFALQASALSREASFIIQAHVAAGSTPPRLEGSDRVIEVATGSPLPPGCDAVVPIEWCRVDGSECRIHPPEGTATHAGLFVHAEGSDGPAGRSVLSAGMALGPAEIAVLATEGKVQVCVNRPPRIALLTTGDEVVSPDVTPGPGQIRGSHAHALQALLTGWGDAEFSHRHVPDERAALRAEIDAALAACDVLLLTGGVSKGKRDYVADSLEDAGVERVFHGVAQRPGRPLWFGMRESTPVLGLPGNPVSALVCARCYVIPALARWRGAIPPGVLHGEISDLPEPLPDLTHFVPLRLGPDGVWQAVLPTTSGSLHVLAGTQALAECPPGLDLPVSIHTWSPIS